jgi:hypothetical protein
VIAAGTVACVALAVQFTARLGEAHDPWYYERASALARKHPSVVSFTPMLFAVTGSEPGCGFWNPINTYGRFGEAVGTERTRRLRFFDEDLVACLKREPEVPVVVDWGFYFFTRHGGALREYLNGEGRDRRVFMSRDAKEQWDEPLLTMDTDR